jgi:hypothetical protein
VHSPRDRRFDEEAERFALVYTCEACGHFDPVREACAHDWPTALHRQARYARPAASGAAVSEVVFCKEFEAR